MIVAAFAAIVLASSGVTVERVGITAPVPRGWSVVGERLTPCVNPIERLTLTGPGGGMVMLQESLDPRRHVARFDRRPARWTLRGEPQPIACCAPSRRAGWFMNFRDNGRAFYVYVYGDTAAARAQALSVLAKLKIEPRHRRPRT
jgi:hypothetical protein